MAKISEEAKIFLSSKSLIRHMLPNGKETLLCDFKTGVKPRLLDKNKKYFVYSVMKLSDGSSYIIKGCHFNQVTAYLVSTEDIFVSEEGIRI